MAKNELNDQLIVRREKLRELRESGLEPFGKKCERTDLAHTLNEKYKGEDEDELNADMPQTKIASRVMIKRGKGKVGFADIYDRTGKIQIYTRKDTIGEKSYQIFKESGLGDFLGTESEVMKTDAGELAVRAYHVAFLPRAFRPLPDKYHGLQNVEQIYHQHYLDLMTNHDSYMRFIHRAKIVQTIRSYLGSRDFSKVKTPVLYNIPGGVEARPSIIHRSALDINLYLRITLELPLRRLIVGGMERIYEVGRVFRNEDVDTRRSPEFTELETYCAYWNFHDVMDEAEGIIRAATEVVTDDSKVNYQGTEIDLGKPFRRVHMVDLVKERTGVNFWRPMTLGGAKKVAEEHGIHTEPFWKVGHIINTFSKEFDEKSIVNPTFVYGHPVEISPLARENADDPRFTGRFEIFAMGMEYDSVFSELNDPIDQRERFETQMAERDAGNDGADIIDEDFVRALEYDMPPIDGLEIGIDHLVMLLIDAPVIRDVLLFPTIRPGRIHDEEKDTDFR